AVLQHTYRGLHGIQCGSACGEHAMAAAHGGGKGGEEGGFLFRGEQGAVHRAGTSMHGDRQGRFRHYCFTSTPSASNFQLVSGSVMASISALLLPASSA